MLDYGHAMNIQTKHSIIKPRTPNQAQYIAHILDHDITLDVGPAGTSKAYPAGTAPLAYMRRSTLNDTFIILNESQNITIEQMEMFLTLIGFNSKAKITGNVTQIDLPRNRKSRLLHAVEVLAEVKKISFNFFHGEDVVRHPMVSRIINTYKDWETSDQKRKEQLASERKRETLTQSNGAALSGNSSHPSEKLNA